MSEDEIHRTEQLAARYTYVRKLQHEGHKEDPDEPGQSLRAEEEILQPVAQAHNAFARVARRFHDIAIARTFGDKPGASSAATLRGDGEEGPSALLDARDDENNPATLQELEKRTKALQAALVQYLKRPK